MKKINFSKIFRKKIKNSNFDSSAAWPVHQIRDWKIIILIFAVCLVALSGFSWRIYLSDKIAGGFLNLEEEYSDSPIKTINQKRLRTDIVLMEEKEANFLELKSNPSKLVDPSI